MMRRTIIERSHKSGKEIVRNFILESVISEGSTLFNFNVREIGVGVRKGKSPGVGAEIDAIVGRALASLHNPTLGSRGCLTRRDEIGNLVRCFRKHQFQSCPRNCKQRVAPPARHWPKRLGRLGK